MMPEEYAENFVLTVRQEMRRSLIEILDKLAIKISSCLSYTKELEKRFGLLCKFEPYVNLRQMKLLRNNFYN